MEISNLAKMRTYLNQGVFIFRLSPFCSEAVFLLSTQTQMKWGFTGKKLEKDVKANIFCKDPLSVSVNGICNYLEWASSDDVNVYFYKILHQCNDTHFNVVRCQQSGCCNLVSGLLTAVPCGIFTEWLYNTEPEAAFTSNINTSVTLIKQMNCTVV